MNNSIDQQMAKIKEEKRIGLMTHVVVGYPSLDITVQLIRVMEKAGADFVELQIPFSDPLADGPTIMRACEQALTNGVRVADAFVMMKQITEQVKIPLLFMAYYNTVFRYGTERFCKDAKRAGCSGLIVPDVPIEEEESEHYLASCNRYGLHSIRVVSPASTPDRLEKNAAVGSGFLYCTAYQGTTGSRLKLDRHSLVNYLQLIKKITGLPLAVGFGISKREDIELLRSNAEIVVIGSAFLDVIARSNKHTIEENVSRFISSLKMVE